MSAFPVRPFVMELRRGLHLWEGRSTATQHQWLATDFYSSVPWYTIKARMQEFNPGWLITCPEIEKGERWHDA